jgi:hypothetical protein
MVPEDNSTSAFCSAHAHNQGAQKITTRPDPSLRSGFRLRGSRSALPRSRLRSRSGSVPKRQIPRSARDFACGAPARPCLAHASALAQAQLPKRQIPRSARDFACGLPARPCLAHASALAQAQLLNARSLAPLGISPAGSRSALPRSRLRKAAQLNNSFG